MSTENYLTLYKESYEFCESKCFPHKLAHQFFASHENEITYLVSDENVRQIVAGVNGNGKILLIDVNEPFKNGKKVVKRTINLNRFKSLNIVEKADKTIKIRRLLQEKDSFLDVLVQAGFAKKGEKLDNLSKGFSLEVHYNLKNYPLQITTYKSCKVLEYNLGPINTENNFVSENILISYEGYNTFETEEKANDITQTNDFNFINDLPKAGRNMITPESVCIFIGSIALNLVQELEINSDFKIST